MEKLSEVPVSTVLILRQTREIQTQENTVLTTT